jgi:hypothetical protein
MIFVYRISECSGDTTIYVSSTPWAPCVETTTWREPC